MRVAPYDSSWGFFIWRWCVFFKKKIIVLLALVVFCFVLFPFLSNPLFFDDQYFFKEGFPEKFLSDGFKFYPRWWVHETLALTYVDFSRKVFWLRLSNVLLHFFVVLALFVFIRELLSFVDKRRMLSVDVEIAAVLAAALFMMHPLATLTHGYLIQRTIICATLFSLLSLLSFWRGLSGNSWWMLLSCVFFVLAVYAKEHVVMLPFVAALLVVLRLRSNEWAGFSWRRLALTLLIQCVIAIVVVLQLKSLIGTPYEMNIGEVLEGEDGIDHAVLYPLSVLNQTALFFRYIGLWLLPLPAMISVDMRVPFSLEMFGPSNLAGVSGFVFYFLVGFLLLLRGRVLGVLGFSMLAPAVLYFTEFSAVRFQEPFVLYRSYLWCVFLFIPIAMVLRRIKFQLAMALSFVFLCFFIAMSFLRLKTYSHPVFVWQEAADVYAAAENKGEVVFGGYRIYYNLGTELSGLGYLNSSISALTRAIELKPSYGWAWNNRGAAYLSKGDYVAAAYDFEKATSLLPGEASPWRGVVAVLKSADNKEELYRAQKMLCLLEGVSKCDSVEIQHSSD